MKCEDCIAEIEEYLDGDIDLQSTEETLAHIDVCNECKCSYEYLKREQEALAPYLLDIKASPGLWAGLQAQIEEEKQASLFSQTSGLKSRVQLLFNTLRFKSLLAGSFALLLIVVSAGLLINLFSKESYINRDFVSVNDKNDNVTATEVGSPTELSNSPEKFPYEETKLPKSTVINAKKIAHKTSEKHINYYVRKQIIKSQVQKGKATAQIQNPKINSLNNTKLNVYKQLYAEVGDTPKRQNILEGEIKKQVEQAQILLRSFRNAIYTEDVALFDLGFDRKQARSLLQKNVSLRRQAEIQDNFEVEVMLENLEPYLLDIANLRDGATASDMQAIKERIRKQEIVASLQVY